MDAESEWQENGCGEARHEDDALPRLPKDDVALGHLLCGIGRRPFCWLSLISPLRNSLPFIGNPFERA